MAASAPQDVKPAERDPGAALGARRYRLPGSEVEVGPLTHLQSERERLAGLRWQHFEARGLGATIGAEIRGLDLTKPLPEAVVAELRQALLDYKVIFFRSQPLSAGQHVAFARRFGELEVHPFIPANPAHPELVRFEKGAAVGGYENGWHSDVSWRVRPSLGAVLHGIGVPATGGDTLFADMAAAYEGLDPELRSHVDGLAAVHDYIHAFGHQVPPEQKAEMRRKFPAVEHPVVRTHPETGRRLLYVNRFFTSHVVGLEPDESRALIERLSRTADLPEIQCRFHWEEHSVAFWDNRAVQHYACCDYWPETRIMERASIIGDRPS